jgi:hypothetical protein
MRSGLSESLDKSFSARRRFRRAAESVVKEIHVPTVDEQFDFFCKTWEPEKPTDSKNIKDEKQPTQKQSSIETIKPVEERTGDVEAAKETTPLIDFLKDDDWQEIMYVKPYYRKHKEQKKLEEKVLFRPKAAMGKYNSLIDF